MGSGVNTDPAALRSLRAEVQRAQQTITEATSRLRSALKRTTWDDAVRSRFESELDHALQAFSRFNAEADTLKATLERKARELDSYLSR